MKLRLLVIGLAAVFSMASAGGGNNNNANNASSGGGDGDVVTAKINIDANTDAVALFESGARGAGCTSERGYKDGLSIIAMNCPNKGGLVVAQKGGEMMIACSSKLYNEQSCRQYAINVLDYAK